MQFSSPAYPVCKPHSSRARPVLGPASALQSSPPGLDVFFDECAFSEVARGLEPQPMATAAPIATRTSECFMIFDTPGPVPIGTLVAMSPDVKDAAALICGA